MGRSETKQAFQTSAAQNATDFANSQKSYADTQKAIEDYNSSLGNYANSVSDFAANNPYADGGEFQADTGRILSNVSDAGAANLRGTLQDTALRTGQNMSGANAAGERIAHENERDLSGGMAAADQARIASKVGYDTTALGAEQGVVQGAQVPISANSNLYTGSGSQANSALGQETENAKTPGFWDQLALTTASAAGQAAGAMCPVEGEPILLADGTEIPVETVTMENDIAQFGGELTRLKESVRSKVQLCVLVTYGSGKHTKVATLHAFKTSDGGYVYADESMGKVVCTPEGSQKVTEVVEIGPQRTYALYVGGNHTYCAGGVWAFD